MEMIMDWVRQITCYMIFSTAAANLIRERSYMKYIRLVMGMILILLLAEPVLSLGNQMESFQWNLDRYLIQEKAYDTALIEQAGMKREKAIINSVKVMIQEELIRMIEQEGFQMDKAELQLEEAVSSEQYGMIKKLELILSQKNESSFRSSFEPPAMIELRKKLAERFQINAEQIQITLY